MDIVTRKGYCHISVRCTHYTCGRYKNIEKGVSKTTYSCSFPKAISSLSSAANIKRQQTKSLCKGLLSFVGNLNELHPDHINNDRWLTNKYQTYGAGGPISRHFNPYFAYEPKGNILLAIGKYWVCVRILVQYFLHITTLIKWTVKCFEYWN